MSPIETDIIAGVTSGAILALLGWGVIRIRKYGSGWWVKQKAKKKREQDMARQMMQQETTEAVLAKVNETLKTLTSTNGGDSVVDRFNGQDEKLDSFGAKLENAAAERVVMVAATQQVAKNLERSEKATLDYRESVGARLAKLDTSMSDISTVVMGMQAKVDESNVTIKTVDEKITRNSGTQPGIGDAVGRIETTQQDQIKRETA